MFTCFCFCALQKIRNMHNEQLMGIRGEEEMEMSDDDTEDSSLSNNKDSEDSGKHICALSSVQLLNDLGYCHCYMLLLCWLQGEYNLYSKKKKKQTNFPSEIFFTQHIV